MPRCLPKWTVRVATGKLYSTVNLLSSPLSTSHLEETSVTECHLASPQLARSRNRGAYRHLHRCIMLVIGNGTTMTETIANYDAKLKALFYRCRERNIKLNKDKIKFNKTEMPYIGHLFTSDVVRADPAKVEGVSSMLKPTDVQGVRRIMNMVNYLAKFLPKLSEVAEPLRQLTQKNVPFNWTDEHDRALAATKELVTEPPLLSYYDPTKALVLQCDASEKGLGAALLQDGRRLAYASRTLTSTEKNYAQIEKQLLAVVFGMQRFHQYTYGRPVIVDSDHWPLETIFKKPLAKEPRFLQKMLMSLQQYGPQLCYMKGSDIYLADTLSRHFIGVASPLQHQSKLAKELEIVEQITEINQMVASRGQNPDYS